MNLKHCPCLQALTHSFPTACCSRSCYAHVTFQRSSTSLRACCLSEFVELHGPKMRGWRCSCVLGRWMRSFPICHCSISQKLVAARIKLPAAAGSCCRFVHNSKRNRDLLSDLARVRIGTCGRSKLRRHRACRRCQHIAASGSGVCNCQRVACAEPSRTTEQQGRSCYLAHQNRMRPRSNH